MAVDVLSRKFRFQPMRSNVIQETLKAFARMIIEIKPEKKWSQKKLSSEDHSDGSVERMAWKRTQHILDENEFLRSAKFVF